ncbi:MAG TPA: hypothetical protein O0X27_07005 [Methanocorpusculum sp.]|nr:hypothetical protein [Methanocorpusculum sp.]
MTEHDFTEPAAADRDLITFGTPDRRITIDATFIPASTAYRMMKLLIRDPDTNRYSDEVYAKTIALFTDEVDAAWIVENTSYLTLDSIVAILISKAFEKSPEKNVL